MVQDTAYATVDAFKTAVTGQTVVYELASPFTVQLTAGEEVRMLGGENNLWADTGDVAVGYRADSKMYIDQTVSNSANAIKLMLTPNVESAMVATKDYTSGSIVIVGNTFLKTTSAVSNGSALTIDVNCSETTTAEWVASLVA